MTLSKLFTRIKNQSTCIGPCMVQTTLKRSGMDHTVFNLQRTPCHLIMSSGLQLDVHHHIQWRRYLVNAYEGNTVMV